MSLCVHVYNLGSTYHERSAQHQMQEWWVWFLGVHEQDLAVVKARWHGRLATQSEKDIAWLFTLLVSENNTIWKFSI